MHLRVLAICAAAAVSVTLHAQNYPAAHPGSRSEKKKAYVLSQFAEARAIYEQRSR